MKYLKYRKKKSFQPKIIGTQSSYLSKMKFFEGEIKTLSDKDWELIANRPTLKTTLKEVLQKEENNVCPKTRSPLRKKKRH